MYPSLQHDLAPPVLREAAGATPSMKKFKLRAPVTIATIVSLLVLNIALVVLARGIQSQSDSWQWVVHTREVLQHVQAALRLTSEAEAAQRGFLLTGNESFVAGYREARDAIIPEVAELRALLRDNRRQQAALQPLEEAVRMRMDLLERVMQEKRAGRVPDVAMLESGQALKQRILTQAQLIRSEEERLLQERQRRVEQGRRELITAFATTAGMAVLLVVLLWVISSRDAARLLAERARLDATLRSIGDGVIATDLQGTVGLMNRVAEELTGTPEPRGVGMPVEQVLRLRDRGTGRPMAPHDAMGDGGDRTMLASGDGQEYAIELSAAPIQPQGEEAMGTVMVVRDVTERNARARALAESEANYRYTVELNPQMPWKASADGSMAYLSDRWLALTGQARAALTGSGWEEVIPAEDRPAAARAWAHAVASGEPYDVEHRIHTFDGQVRWVRARANPRRDDTGAIVAWYGLTEDIHARKESELALIEANQLLEQRVEERTAQIEEANAELRAFAHTIAHDLRAPLRNLEGFATALIEDEAERMSEDGRLFAGRIVAAVVRMDRLITDLLAYSRLSRAELRLERVDLGIVMKTVLRDLEAQVAESGARLDIAWPLPAVRGNATILVQVIANLVSNAIKFVDKGVVPHVTVAGSRAGPVARLVIGDNGIGIAPEHREHVFGVFERLHGHERYPGTGIGLAIVKKGLERMDGTVAILGREGGGTTLELSMQAAD